MYNLLCVLLAYGVHWEHVSRMLPTKRRGQSEARKREHVPVVLVDMLLQGM